MARILTLKYDGCEYEVDANLPNPVADSYFSPSPYGLRKLKCKLCGDKPNVYAKPSIRHLVWKHPHTIPEVADFRRKLRTGEVSGRKNTHYYRGLDKHVAYLRENYRKIFGREMEFVQPDSNGRRV